MDLDQTIIHTTQDQVPEKQKDVYHFKVLMASDWLIILILLTSDWLQLHGDRSPWYHTRLRPGTFEFLEKISSLYELHICTFGQRLYAHKIAEFLDPNKKYFSHRYIILTSEM